MLGQRGVVTSTGQAASEYDVKALFLLNFARFVEWPALSPAEAKEPFSICIVGDDPFRDTLDHLVQDEKINGRQIVVRRVSRPEDSCQVLFVSASERNVLRTLSQAGRGVLTVGEAVGFLSDGGMIGFVLDDRRVRFDINLKAATSASISISSRLLSVARMVSR